MRRTYFLVLFFVLGAFLLFFLTHRRREEVEMVERGSPYLVEYVKNFLFNSGFELGEGDRPDGWRMEGAFDGVYFLRDAIEKFDGRFSANITSDVRITNGRLNRSSLVQEISEFPKNKKFILYGAVKTYKVDTVFMRIEVYDTLGNLKSFNSTEFITGTSDWRVYTTAVLVDEDASKLEVRCTLIGRGRAWFDDVEVVAVSYEAEDYPFWWRYWVRQFKRE
jgi:hypothetical protein